MHKLRQTANAARTSMSKRRAKTPACFGLRAMVVAAAFATFAAFGAPVQAQEDIRIGAIFPFTGGASTFGNQNFQGVDIAADLVNDRGGINGRKIVLLKGDANNTQAAASEVNRLISVEGVNIFLGSSISSASMVATQEAERSGAFYWEGMAVANDVTNRGFQNTFRFGMNASGLGLPAAKYTAHVLPEKLGVPVDGLKVAILAEDSGFGTDVSAAADAYVTEQGAKVVMHESYSSKITDLSSAILKMRSANPDVVIVTQFINDAILLQRQMRDLGFTPKAFLGTGAGQATSSFAEALGDDVNGIFSSSYPPDVNPEGLSDRAKTDLQEFLKRYEAKYNVVPAVQESLGFVVGLALFEDIIANAASTDPVDLSAAARAVDLPMGTYINGWGMKFDEKGQNTMADGAVVQWQDQKMIVIYPENLSMADPIMVPLPGSN
ncbi:MAG: ABC transporter substrate-binding protein [Hyphomicrobiaceae bacterium]|nr:ABC transporter substrate-binding protein [Hyphomicrobiaceae bacterium]